MYSNIRICIAIHTQAQVAPYQNNQFNTAEVFDMPSAGYLNSTLTHTLFQKSEVHSQSECSYELLYHRSILSFEYLKSSIPAELHWTCLISWDEQPHGPMASKPNTTRMLVYFITVSILSLTPTLNMTRKQLWRLQSLLFPWRSRMPTTKQHRHSSTHTIHRI